MNDDLNSSLLSRYRGRASARISPPNVRFMRTNSPDAARPGCSVLCVLCFADQRDSARIPRQVSLRSLTAFSSIASRWGYAGLPPKPLPRFARLQAIFQSSLYGVCSVPSGRRISVHAVTLSCGGYFAACASSNSTPWPGRSASVIAPSSTCGVPGKISAVAPP